jgi:hypothetical protein
MRDQEHIPAEVLLEYAESRVDQEVAARVRAHLGTGCPYCARHVTFWTRALAALRRDATPAPPAHVVERAIALFDRGPESAAQPALRPSPWASIVARLTFDSRIQQAPVGVRDVGAPSFQLLFEAEGIEIDLLCECDAGVWRITGQAISPDAPKARWRVAATGAGEAATETDADGEFHLSGLATGAYELTLRGIDREILLPHVGLEAAPGEG